MNVHLLQHLPECVRLWGPLWAYSCFHFENLNGFLKSLFHGTRDMTKQVHFNVPPFPPVLPHLTVLPIQMAFSYVVMQALPSTLLQFQNCTNAVRTFANSLYGRKKYVLRQHS